MSCFRHFRFKVSLSIFALTFFYLSCSSYLGNFPVMLVGFQYSYISLRHFRLCLLLGANVKNDIHFYCSRLNLMAGKEMKKFI